MEKVIKSVNALKFAYGEIEAVEEKTLKDGMLMPKERQLHCNTIVDCMISSSLRSNNDFTALLGISLEILLLSCSDDSADVRLSAEECLNRLIKGIYETSIHRVLVELFKEIKKNGATRSMKAALVRFSDLCFNVRPAKCRPYMLNLLPCLVHVSQREEEAIQEALAPAVFKILSNLGSFANENEVQGLVASFLKNLSHDSVTVRRTAGSCLHSIVSTSRRISVTLLPLIDSILDILTQRRDNRSTILGCLPSLRAITPLLTSIPPDILSNILAKLMMFTIYYCHHSDHTVVTSSLELMEQLLKYFTHQFKSILMKEKLEPCYPMQEQKQTLPENSSRGNGSVIATPSENEQSPSILSWKDVCSSQHKTPGLEHSAMVQLARLLCQRFLLQQGEIQLLSDSKVRVSSKTLSLECATHLISIQPLLFTIPLSEGQTEGTSVYDMTLYLQHTDPKLRGAVLMLLAIYIKSVLVESSGDVEKWQESQKLNHPAMVSSKFPSLNGLVDKLVKSFSDDVSTCLRQSCSAASICVDALLRCRHFYLGLRLLRSVLSLSSNSYWLVKVDLLSLLGSLNFRQIAFLESHEKPSKISPIKPFQEASLSAMLACLSEDDGRIRKAAAESIVSAVEGLSLRSNVDTNSLSSEAFALSRVQLGKGLLGNADDVTHHVNDLAADKSLLKIYRGFECFQVPKQLEDCLSLMIGEITRLLSQSTSKSVTQGCILALKLLSFKYSPGSYVLSWGCYFSVQETPQSKSRSGSTASNSSGKTESNNSQDLAQNLGLLPIIMGLLKSSWLPLDLSTHCDVIILAGNLLAGAANYGLRYEKEEPSTEHHESSQSTHGKGWSGVSDPVLSKYARDLFLHLIKICSICHHVVADVSPHSANKSVLPTISASATLPSPIKKKDKKEAASDPKSSPPSARKLLPSANKPGTSKEESEREKPSKKALGSFHHNRVLMKLYELLQGAYTNYKSNLEFGDNDRFCFFVSSCLDVMCQLLEIASSQDIATTTEELLGYLKTLFAVQPSHTVQCVQQLLKAIFGTNLLAQLELADKARTSRSASKTSAQLVATHRYKPTISHQIFHLPLNNLTISLANSSFHHSLTSASKEEGGWFGSIKKKVEEKLNQSSKQAKGSKISSYIRLFESLVIKSLKGYTVTSSVEFQKHVLNMLAQLVQLRVNYNMLDSDQVFIGFIIKQFESIETGMIRNSESLVPHVFFFLVLLTYEKYHTKSVISMSKVIQLCDGLMASGRGVETHVIPALDPIVHDLFVVRASNKRGQGETTEREVLMQMIIRLLHYPQVYRMTTTVLRFCRNDDVDRWKQASRNVVDVILPIVANLQMKLCGPDDVSNLFSLFETLSPTALRPTTTLLQVLFSNTPKVTLSTIHCWLAKILLILRLLVCNVGEDELIATVGHVNNTVHLGNFFGNENFAEVAKTENEAQMIARFFNHVIGYLSTELASALTSTTSTATPSDLLFLVKEFIELLILLTYIHRSGTYKKFTISSREFLQSNSQPPHIENFLLIGEYYPVLTLVWAQYLTHIGCINMQQWGILTGTNSFHSYPTFNKRILHAGSLVLLCDYACQNVNQSELTSWLITHHLADVIELSGEAPVEDFLNTVKQTPAAKELLSAVASHCASDTSIKPSFTQRLLRFISSLPDSLAMLQLLLSSQFVFSPILALSSASELVACRSVESLLVLEPFEVTSVVTWNDVDQLTQRFSSNQQKRFVRLHALLVRLKDHVSDEAASSPPPANELPSIESIKETANKAWLKSLLIAALEKDEWTPECAKVLSCCEFNDVMEVMSNQSFSSQHLDVCVAYGISESVSTSDTISHLDDTLSSIMKAALKTMMNLTNAVLGRDSPPASSTQLNATEPSREALWRDDFLIGNLSFLTKCMARYLHANPSLLTQYKLPVAAYPQCLKLALLSCQMISWQLRHGSLPAFSVSTSCFEILQQTLKSDEANDRFISSREDVLSVIETLHMLVSAYVGQLPLTPPYFPELPSFKIDERCRDCCVMMSQLFDFVRHNNEALRHHLPAVLIDPMHNIILHLCRSELLNSYIRAPRLLWKYGWNPTCSDITQLPDIPADYLQEKEILSDFISILNHIGWISRTQFEETWASLLGVLVSQPIIDATSGKRAHEDAVSVSCLAVRGLTSLVLHCALLPHAGAPTTGSFTIHHRHSSIKLPHSKWSRKLVRIRRILQEELLASLPTMHHCDTHYTYQRSPQGGDIHHHLVRNTERMMDTSSGYGLGQISAKSFYELHGIRPLRDETSDVDSESIRTSQESDEESDVFDSEGKSTQGRQSGGTRSLSPLRIRDGVDVHSCVQFLLDLYAGWFRPTSESGGAAPPVARPLLCECMRSLLLISDLFTEQHQFEWLLQTITTFYGSQHADDDVMLQYVVTSLCKASAVLGMGGNTSEILLPMLESAMTSSSVSCRVAALHGALYCLECYPNPHIRDIVAFLIESVPKQLVDVAGNPSLHNEDLILSLIALAYFITEQCQDLIPPEYISIILQSSSLIFSAADTTTPVYHAVAHGLERLVLVFALSSSQTNAVLKVAAEQLSHNSSLSRATAACALMVTCMYCGRMRASFSNQNEASPPGGSSEHEDAVENNLLAMERVSLIFERLRRGSSFDARVMARVLPPILNDFFPAATILNKVIAEFASNLQPFPDMLAGVLHKVFQSLHDRDQSILVNEWVMLSLNNVVQRTPLSTAVWCLTCLFVSASSNHWINSLLPMVISCMKQPEANRDWPLFCKAAIDFYSHQLQEELDRRTFRSVFSANEEPYRMLLRCLESK